MSAKVAGLIVSLAVVAGLVTATRYSARAHTSDIPSDVFFTDAPSPGTTRDTAVFAGGCFWGIEGVFDHMNGVESSVSGYAGGTLDNPTYDEVTTGQTGHAEAVRVVFDPAVVSYSDLLKVFFSVAHDPTELNRQGPDVGTQYRSAIFFRNEAQQSATAAYIAHLTKTRAFRSAIVTQVAPLTKFYMAEEYHQDYMEHNPQSMYIIVNDAPKVERLRTQFPQHYRERNQ